MPLYTYKCPKCGQTKEELRKLNDESSVLCFCQEWKPGTSMEQVLSTPSAPQWKCGAAHSRSKGF